MSVSSVLGKRTCGQAGFRGQTERSAFSTVIPQPKPNLKSTEAITVQALFAIEDSGSSEIRNGHVPACQVNALGQARLGLAYFYRKGVNQDFEKAFRLFELSAYQGHAFGIFCKSNLTPQ